MNLDAKMLMLYKLIEQMHNLIKDGIPYIRLSKIDNNINKDVLQEMILDIDNILTSKNGELVKLLKEENKKKYKLLYIGYSKTCDELVKILSINYLKLKAETLKNFLYIYTVLYYYGKSLNILPD